MIVFASGVTVATGALIVAADRAAHANAYVGIGAGLCAILVAVVLPLWRWLHNQRLHQEEFQRHQTETLNRVFEGLFGRPEIIDSGVVVAPKTEGLIEQSARLKDQFAEMATRVARLETQLTEGSAPLLEMKAALERNHTENSHRLDNHERQISEARHVAGAAATAAAAAKDRVEFLAGRWWEYVEGLEQSNRFLRAVATEHGYDVGHPEVTSDEPPDVHDPRPSGD